MKLAAIDFDNDNELRVIAGPCVIESEELTLTIAEELRRIGESLDVAIVFKASFDKANRTSLRSFRGIGFEPALRVLERVRSDIGLPVLTDVHEYTPLSEVADVVDALQTPALLCRQTDFIIAVASHGLPVNLKKGQFLSAGEMLNVVEKARSTGNDRLLVTERGTCFGYHDLVVDMRSLAVLAETGCPVIYDAGHSVQQPGALGDASGGRRRFLPGLARAAVAAGVAGLFVETHPDPDQARSDGPVSWPLPKLAGLLDELLAIDRVVKARRSSDTSIAREAAHA